MKIYTRGGDTGETSTFGGGRVRKDDLRIEACGAVDELNAMLGVACAELEDPDLEERLREIQAHLFDVGGELATPDVEAREARGKGVPRVRDADVDDLEKTIDRLEQELEEIRSFILPGGSRAAARLHLARAVCRRAERRVVALGARQEVAAPLLRYLNRLSDALFVMARAANRRSGVAEVFWKGMSG